MHISAYIKNYSKVYCRPKHHMEMNYQVLACHVSVLGKTPLCTLYMDCWTGITDSLLLRVQEDLKQRALSAETQAASPRSESLYSLRTGTSIL
jgi:hypothetical protein